MSEQGTASALKLITELKATAHLMMLDDGVFCVFHSAGGAPPDARTGLPGVRLSLPPVVQGEVEISTFRPDGWIGGSWGAALVRVQRGPASVLVTVYQLAEGAREAPRLQVLRLTEEPGRVARAEPAVLRPAVAAQGHEVLAHIYGRGDVGGSLGAWIGERGSRRQIEGFAITPGEAIGAEGIEYQAVLGRDWLSPWAEGGQFCGSRGMSLPVLGVKMRLRGAAAETHEVRVTGAFVDGTEVGPVPGEEGCQAVSLAALEALRVEIAPRAVAAPRVAAEAPRWAPRAAARRAAPAPKPAPPPRGKPKRR